MRIAYCSDSLPPVTDGVTRTLGALVSTLLDAGVEFQFVSAVRPDPELAWRDRVHTVPSVPFPLYPYYRVGLPVARTVDRVLDRFAPDLVHVVTPSFLGLYGVKYAQRRGIPAVASFHTDFVTLFAHYGLRRLQRLGRYLERRFYGQCTVTLAPSRHQAARLRAQGIANVALWQRGVSPATFSPSFRSPALRAALGATDIPIVLYVGRLGREKNLPFLADAMHLLERRMGSDAFRLVIVGRGPLRRALQARLPGAHFTGELTGAELSRAYASADLFVFPCVLETFGNVVLEAFASGLPVVGVNEGAVPELITPNVNGLLAAPGSAAAFADKVHTLLERAPDRSRMGLGARITAAEHGWPDANRPLLEIYAGLAGAGGHGGGSERALAVAV
jgi:glycosyltransferase involved in cell wall biosynthesis